MCVKKGYSMPWPGSRLAVFSLVLLVGVRALENVPFMLRRARLARFTPTGSVKTSITEPQCPADEENSCITSTPATISPMPISAAASSVWPCQYQAMAETSTMPAPDQIA